MASLTTGISNSSGSTRPDLPIAPSSGSVPTTFPQFKVRVIYTCPNEVYTRFPNNKPVDLYWRLYSHVSPQEPCSEPYKLSIGFFSLDERLGVASSVVANGIRTTTVLKFMDPFMDPPNCLERSIETTIPFTEHSDSQTFNVVQVLMLAPDEHMGTDAIHMGTDVKTITIQAGKTYTFACNLAKKVREDGTLITVANFNGHVEEG